MLSYFARAIRRIPSPRLAVMSYIAGVIVTTAGNAVARVVFA